MLKFGAKIQVKPFMHDRFLYFSNTNDVFERISIHEIS